jgi:hypothetical protein
MIKKSSRPESETEKAAVPELLKEGFSLRRLKISSRLKGQKAKSEEKQ